MNIQQPTPREITSVSFSFYSSEEIRNLSVKQISNPEAFDNLDHPTKGGVYDSALGPLSRAESCSTCNLGYFSCPGHFGHIELVVNVYNPITFKLMYKLLQSTCYYCHHLRSSRLVVAHFAAKLRLVYAGLIVEASELDRYIAMKGAAGGMGAKKAAAKGGKSGDKKKGKSGSSGKMVEDQAAEGEESEEEESEEEGGREESKVDWDELTPKRSAQEWIDEIEAYVRRCFSANSGSSGRPAKLTLVTEALRTLEREFLAAIPSQSCANCRGQGPKFRTEGQHKIFERAMPSKQKAVMDARGFTFQNAKEELAKIEKREAGKLLQNGANDESDLEAMEVDYATQQAEEPPTSDDDSDSEAVTRREVGDALAENSNALIGMEAQETSTADKAEKAATVVNRDKPLTPMQVRDHIRLLWHRERKILDLLYGNTSSTSAGGKRISSSDMFFIDVVAVPPNKFRPISKMGDMQYDHPQNTYLIQVLKADALVRSTHAERLAAMNAAPSAKLRHEASQEGLRKVVEAWIKLTQAVNYLIDSSKAPMAPGGKQAPNGIRQLLEKKEGLFRKHMMGKRVNYAARSVISPDPYIETSEIGIPPVFATKLTYPEPVTHHNIKELRRAVINGPSKWPGATHVQNEDGVIMNLAMFDEAGRTALANQLLTPGVGNDGTPTHVNKRVTRHLRNGDFLLLNRQPTLHKPSIMAHTARVLPGEKTIRMHYANCLAGDCKVLMADGTTVRLDEVPTGAQVAAWAAREQPPAVPVTVAGVGTNVAIPYEAENTYDIGGSHTVTKGKWYRGIQECLTLTLDDGRTLVGTPDHRVLACPPTANDESPDFANAVYVPISELSKEGSKNGWRVLCSATDEIRAVDESEEERGKLMRFKLSDDLSCKNDPTRVFAMLRLCGACMTDGNKNTIYERFHYVYFSCGTWEDVQELLRDIRMVDPESKPKVSFSTSEKFGSCFRVSVAGVVPEVMHELGMPSGRRSDSASWMFGFVTDPETPKLALQHFLAGWWGGDGSSPTFSDSGDTVSIGRCGIITRLAADGVGNEESRASLRNYMAALQSAFAAIGIKIRLAERYICSVEAQDGSQDRMLPYNPQTGTPHASVASLLVRLVLDAPEAMSEDELYTAACEAYEDSGLKMQGIIRSELNHLLERGKPSKKRRRSAWATVLQIRDNVVVVADDYKENAEAFVNESDTYNVLQRYFRIDICMSAEETHKFVDHVGVAYSGEKWGKWHLLYAYRNIGLRVCRQRYILLTDAIHRWRQNRSTREAEKTAGVSTRKMTRLMNISTAIAEAVQALEEVEVVHPAAVPGVGFFKNYTAGHYSLPASVDLVNRGTFSLPRDTFPMFKDFVRETGFNWYRLGEDRNRNNPNSFTLAVADVRTAGALPVYDLEVKDVHNFVANGIVVHNCNTYNADFDGDEMNAHFPQNEVARAEAMLIARTDLQYLVPTDGGVLRGLIQDHVDAGVDMTSRNTVFSREEYMQLVYAALKPEKMVGGLGNGNIETQVEIGMDGRVLVEEPAILKPRVYWTGKQVISTILKNLTARFEPINLISKAKIPAKAWGPSAPEEQTVLFMDGELLTGVLDKSQFGASAHGIVHAVYEIYGPPYAGKLLSIFGRLFTSYLQLVGFSCRMDDLILTPAGDKKRRDLIDGSKPMGREAAAEFVSLKDNTDDARLALKLETVLRSSELMAGLDNAMKSRTNKVTSAIISTCIPDTLHKPFPQNNMQMMTVSGAKGSNVNVSQISCLLGQQELEGKRVPTMVSGKTLPSFRPFDTSARAGGYITGRFLTGIKPQEYYFHCMAGREGLIDTAVKTSRSGYLQRCLIKHLEGLRVHYDHTVRDLDGSVLQFHYGEDSLDVIKQKTLNKFDFCAMNYRALVGRYNPAKLEGKAVDQAEVRKWRKKVKKGKVEGEEAGVVLSRFSPSRYLGAVSEKFAGELEKYVEENESKLLASKHSEPAPRGAWSGQPVPSKNFQYLMELKYMNSLVEPGEAVGLLAAQSIGEPSTQMTLNTFHFAGFGAKNVTLGIPRLREIIMTASADIKTPMMRLPLLPRAKNDGDVLCKQISRLVLAQVMEGVTVTERLSKKGGDLTRKKILTLRLKFWPRAAYEAEHGLTPEALGHVIERKFVRALERAIQKDLKGRVKKGADDDEAEQIGVALGNYDKATGSGEGGEGDGGDDDEAGAALLSSSKSQKGGKAATSKRAAATAPADDDDDDDVGSDDGGDDDDATAAKKAKNRAQHATYDAPDEDDEEIIRGVNRAMSEEADDDGDAESMAGDGAVDADGKTREERIAEESKYVVGYKFDGKHGRWCEIQMNFAANTKKLLMVALAEAVARDVVIHEVKGISRCYPLPNDSENDKSVNIGTDGVNLHGMWDFDTQIDVQNMYTNDIAAILRTYGVEAARAAIMQEIAGVFGVYGINVDTRHLSLIADYMTFEGGYKPFNRMGMNSNPSPFAQMSFETTTNFLTTATLTGDFDPLDSPSARLVIGKPVLGGTGAFEILQPLPKNKATSKMANGRRANSTLVADMVVEAY